MKTVGFIGAYDKTDLIIYIARILTAMQKKVLIIDRTLLQKVRYIVPIIKQEKSFVTTYEDVDIAIGFSSYSAIKEYLNMPQHAVFDYDYIFIDIDSVQALEQFDIKKADKIYFVSGFDNFSLKKGIQIISTFPEPIPMTKILFSRNITKEENAYFDNLIADLKIQWNEMIIYFPFEQGDQSAIMENQRIGKIKFRKLTSIFKESLMYLSQDILGENDESALLKKVFKRLEKGV